MINLCLLVLKEQKMTFSNEGTTGLTYSNLAPKPVDFVEAIKGAFSKYATFKGRASRSEFWYFALYYFSMFALVVLGVLDESGIFGTIGLISILASIIPFYSVMVRRLHDTGKSGWWYWISVIPFGGFVVIFFLSQEGESKDNDHGPQSL